MYRGLKAQAKPLNLVRLHRPNLLLRIDNNCAKMIWFNWKQLMNFFFISATTFFLSLLSAVAHAERCNLSGLDSLSISPPFDSYDGNIEVDLLPVFLKIGPVDGENYQFYGDFYLNSYWYDDTLADKIFKNSQSEWCQLEGSQVSDLMWTPGIEYTNVVEVQESLLNKIYINVDGVIHHEQRVQGHFASDLDFSEFPFDRQILKITMMPFNPDSVDLMGIPPYDEWTHNLKFRDWKLIKAEGSEASFEYLGDTYPTYEFQLFIDRIPNFYVIKVIVPVFIMSLLALCGFLISPADFDARLGVTVTLLLTVVAYTFIASENLPVLSYLTFVDAYLVVWFFICVICLLGTVLFRLLIGVEYDDNDLLTLKMHRISKFTGLFLFCVYGATVWFLYLIV